MTVVSQFSDLQGAQLSAVCFVRSYVELNFDGPILRLLAPPVVSYAGKTLQFPAERSRDALCALIGRTVQHTEDLPDRLIVVFPNASIEMPKASPDAGPEVAHFVPLAEGIPDVASMVIWENLTPTRDNATPS